MAPPPPTAAASATLPVRSTWIDGPARDLLLYVATPLLLLPLVFLGSGRPDLQQLILYVGGFGALGHHLPGMMRAYGDRALFARFRWRFVLAPLVLVPVCIWFSVHELGGIVLVTFFWTNWHSLMQIFGFARIYDAKHGASSPWTSRLDQALCVAWIGAPLLLADSRLGNLLELWYGSGGPLVPPALVGAVRTAWLGLTAAATVAWLAHTAVALRRGAGPNPVKVLLFTTSFAFWWLCMAGVESLLVGVALFDVVHDVQYLALVWAFNKARVASDPAVGGFSRFLFRGRMALAGVYVGLVVAYGSMGYFSDSIDDALVRRTLLGVLAASALLHFYFDGFIWKVRERSTRAALSVAGGGADIRLGGLLPGWSVHGTKWLGFVLPLGLLWWWDVHDERPEREWREAVVAAAPDSAEALTKLGRLLDVGVDPERVLGLHRRAIELKPGWAPAHNNLGTALFVLGDMDAARRAFLEALRVQPDYAVAHRNLASLLATTDEPDLAAAHFRRALLEDPGDAKAHAGLAAILVRRGEIDDAVRGWERALELDPRERTALDNLAWLLATSPDPARRNGARALELASSLAGVVGGEEPMVLCTLAAACAEAGRFADAVRNATAAIEGARARGRHDVASALETHLHEYEQGRPLRTPY